MPFGLNEPDHAAICRVLANHPQVDKVLIYGSRALGTHRPGSDIDLVFLGNGLNVPELSRIEADLDDLLLPYTFDIALLQSIENADLRSHIQRVGKIFYNRSQG
jgi:predicted nucleotidyltransferase